MDIDKNHTSLSAGLPPPKKIKLCCIDYSELQSCIEMDFFISWFLDDRRTSLAGSYHHGIGGCSHHFLEIKILFSSSLWTKWGWKTFRGHGHAVGTCLLDSHWVQDIRCFPKGRSMTWKDDLIPVEIRFQLQTFRQSVACQFSPSLCDPSHSSWPGPFLMTWRTGPILISHGMSLWDLFSHFHNPEVLTCIFLPESFLHGAGYWSNIASFLPCTDPDVYWVLCKYQLSGIE